MSVRRSKAPQKFLSRPAALKLDAEVDRALAQIIQVPQRWAVGSFSTRRSCVLFSFGEKSGLSGLGGFPVAFDSGKEKTTSWEEVASEIWRSCPMRTSAAEFHEESAAEYVGASVPLVRGLTTLLRTM